MSRSPSPAELDALAWWWLAKRSLVRAATLSGKHRQTLANQLQAFRRLEEATDNVELALKYIDQIEQRKLDLLDRAA